MRWTVNYVLSTEDEITSLFGRWVKLDEVDEVTSLFGRWAKLDEVDCKLCIIHGGRDH